MVQLNLPQMEDVAPPEVEEENPEHLDKSELYTRYRTLMSYIQDDFTMFFYIMVCLEKYLKAPSQTEQELGLDALEKLLKKFQKMFEESKGLVALYREGIEALVVDNFGENWREYHLVQQKEELTDEEFIARAIAQDINALKQMGWEFIG